MSPPPSPNFGENLRPPSSLAGSFTSGSSLQLPTSDSPSLIMSVSTNNTNMGSSKVHRTVTKTSSFQSLKQKFSSGSLFGRAKLSNTDGALQTLQGLFEKPSRGSLKEALATEVQKELDNCDCVVPCLCDVLGRDLGSMQVSAHEESGRSAKAIEKEVVSVTEEGGDSFLIDLDDKVKSDEGLPKLKEQKRPVLQIDTGISNSARPTGASVQTANPKRHSTYDSHLMTGRTLRHKVGSVQPTQSVSNVSATNPEFVVPARPRTNTLRPSSIYVPPRIVENASSTPTPSTPSTPGSGYKFFSTASSGRHQLHPRTASVSSLFSTSTHSLTSYLSGTGSTTSSRPETPRSTSERESAFAKEYVSFPPYQAEGSATSYASSLEDVGKWVGGVGRRLTRKIRRGSEALGGEQQKNTEEKEAEEAKPAQGPALERRRGRAGRRVY